MEAKYNNAIKKPGSLSPRVKYLRDYYFEGVSREWNNEYNCYSTGTAWDLQFNELTYFIVPETYMFFDTFIRSVNQAAEVIPLPEDFFDMSIPERVAEFNRRAIAEHMPAELLPGDLLCGARFNLLSSMCLTEKEQKERDALTAKAETLPFYFISAATATAVLPAAILFRTMRVY